VVVVLVLVFKGPEKETSTYVLDAFTPFAFYVFLVEVGAP